MVQSKLQSTSKPFQIDIENPEIIYPPPNTISVKVDQMPLPNKRKPSLTSRFLYLIQFIISILALTLPIIMIKLGWFIRAFSSVSTHLGLQIPEIENAINCYLWLSFFSLTIAGTLHAIIALWMFFFKNVEPVLLFTLPNLAQFWQQITLSFLLLDGILLLCHLQFYFSIHLYILWIAHLDSFLMIQWYNRKLDLELQKYHILPC